MQLKCKCSNFELAVQVRTTGGILSLDFYCANCTVLKEKKAPFKFSKDEPMFREQEQPEDRFIRDSKEELNAEEQCIAAGAKTSLEEEEESQEFLDEWMAAGTGVVQLEPSAANRGDWELQKVSNAPEGSYAEKVMEVGNFFNFTKPNLEKVFGASYYAVSNWFKGAKPVNKFRDRIDYVVKVMEEIKSMYGDLHFKRNNKKLRELLADQKINKTLVKAQAL